MKKTYLITGLMLLGLIFTNTNAQGRRGTANCNFDNGASACQRLNLDEEQQQKVEAERVAFMKDVQAERNEINELRARKRTLETTDPLDKKELDKVLLAMNKASTSIQKKKLRHHQSIKQLLTDAQLIQFDNRSFNQRGNGFENGDRTRNGKGRRSAYGRKGGNSMPCENGQGYGQGRGVNGRQQGQGYRADCMLLNADEKAALKATHTKMLKQQQPYKNEMNELRAQLKTVCTGKEVDLKKADRLIDQQATARLEMAKIRASYKSELRSQLSDEQKAMWDSKRGRGHKGRGHRRAY